MGQPFFEGAVSLFRRLLRDESGQDLIEYALLAVVVALASLAALNLLQGALGENYSAWEAGNQDLWIMPAPG